VLVIDIPGYRKLELRYLVLDYNGTLAEEGQLRTGVADDLRCLANQLEIQVVTADTFGTAANALRNLPLQLTVLPAENQTAAKAELVNKLGAANVVAIGNGANDREMLATAELGIAVMEREGLAQITATAADVLCRDIREALALLIHPRRLIATLRR